MASIPRKLVSGFALLSALSVAQPAWAGEPTPADKDTARALMGNANKAYADQDYKHALEYFSGADAIMHLPTTGLGVMRSQEKLGLLVEARDTALAIGRLPPKDNEAQPDQDARAEAAKLAASIEPRIATITIQPSGLAADAKATVVIDGETLPAAAATAPRKVDPGKHTVVASAPGYEEGKADITIGEGETQSVPLALKAIPGWKAPAPPEPKGTTVVETKKPIHPLLFVGIATAGVGVIVGSAAGGVALANGGKCSTKAGAVLNGKALPSCPTTVAHVSTAGFAVAGVGGILTLVAIPLSIGTTTTVKGATVQPVLGPGFAGVEGAF